MLFARVQRFLTAPIDKKSRSRVIFWFSLSLTFAAIYGILGLQEAFRSEYVLQDDARQHVFWMQRFFDPGLFPKDLIADYYQSTAPLGYTTFYRLFAVLGINPILLSKLLPIVLGVVTTGYSFALCMEILPVPAAGLISTLLINLALWGGATIVTATPRAFFWPFFVAFLYYLLRRALFPCLVAIALQGLFYPPSLLITAGLLILRLLRWERGLPRLSLDRSNILLCATGLGVVFLGLLPEVLSSSEFGPTITLAQARVSPEFSPEGRTSFFRDNPWAFWLNNNRTALMGWPWNPPILYGALALPILLRYPTRFPLARHVTPGVTVLLQLLLVSVSLFLAAHALLFKLYLPSRYMQTIAIVFPLAAGIALIVILDAVFHAGEQQTKITPRAVALFFAVYALLVTVYYPGGYTKKGLVALLVLGAAIALILLLLDSIFHRSKQGGEPFLGRQFLALASTAVLAVALIVSPMKVFPKNDYTVGKEPQLYKFFAQQPKDILIAALAEETDNLPSFAKRSILVGREYALPYHTGYYAKIRQRTIDLINAQYSPDLKQVQNFIQKYGVDFWILDQKAFTPEYIAKPGAKISRWIRQFQPAATEALESVKKGTVPALARVSDRCLVLESDRLIVVNTECIAKLPPD